MKRYTLSDFDDIRPYSDQELPAAINRLINDKTLTSEVANILWKRCPLFFKPVYDDLVRFYIKGLIKNVNSVHDFQKSVVSKLGMNWVVNNTIDDIGISGLENINRNEHYLYISNHRDIVLDSASLNYHLLKNGYDTAEIAFGDNLMMNGIVTDLIRSNKSFIVKRGLPLRKQYKASVHLAHYIWYTINQGNSVWIAQDGGRAKDGDDRTNPGLIKVLSTAKRDSGLSFSRFINACHIVPTAVSYEFDPCDEYKAHELYIKKETGIYQKKSDEDLRSIIAGIKGKKGRVHVALGTVLSGDWKNPKEVAAFIDHEIHKNYRLWPTNYIAYDLKHNSEKYREFYTIHQKHIFIKRMESYPEHLREIICQCYAKPQENRESVHGLVMHS